MNIMQAATIPHVIMMRANPKPRAHPPQHKVARHIEQRIAKKKYSRARAVYRIAEVQLPLHIHRGKANIHAIHIGNDVQQKKIRESVDA